MNAKGVFKHMDFLTCLPLSSSLRNVMISPNLPVKNQGVEEVATCTR